MLTVNDHVACDRFPLPPDPADNDDRDEVRAWNIAAVMHKADGMRFLEFLTTLDRQMPGDTEAAEMVEGMREFARRFWDEKYRGERWTR